MREQLTATFTVVDCTGQRSTAKEFRKAIEFAMDGQGHSLLGSRRFELENGNPLNPSDDGLFEDPITGTVWSRE